MNQSHPTNPGETCAARLSCQADESAVSEDQGAEEAFVGAKKECSECSGATVTLRPCWILDLRPGAGASVSSLHQSQHGEWIRGDGCSPHAHVRHQGVDVRCDVEQGYAELGWHFQLVILHLHGCLRVNGHSYGWPPCLGATSQCCSASRSRQTERSQPHDNEQCLPPHVLFTEDEANLWLALGRRGSSQAHVHTTKAQPPRVTRVDHPWRRLRGAPGSATRTLSPTSSCAWWCSTCSLWCGFPEGGSRGFVDTRGGFTWALELTVERMGWLWDGS